MKILYSSVLVLIYSVIVQGQIQSVIGNTGGEYKANGYVVEYTLGETIIPTLYNNKFILTQGFHQPDILRSTAIVHLDDSAFEINVFPNPFRTTTTISLRGEDIPKMWFDLVDLQGRIVRSSEGTSFSEDVIVQGSHLTEGVYFLIFRDKSHRAIYSTKILKLQ